MTVASKRFAIITAYELQAEAVISFYFLRRKYSAKVINTDRSINSSVNVMYIISPPFKF